MKKPPQTAIDDRLLNVAIEQFGRAGLEGASTRAIAAEANTAMSSITYHYGGKEGLYLAAARHIAANIGGRFEKAMVAAADPRDLDPAQATAQILELVDTFMAVMLTAEAAPWARFIVREQLEPTEAFTVMWELFMGPLTGRLVALVMRAGGGRWKLADARVRSLALFGQVLIFRVARGTTLGVTGWKEIGPTQIAEIRRVLHANVRTLLASPEDKS